MSSNCASGMPRWKHNSARISRPLHSGIGFFTKLPGWSISSAYTHITTVSAGCPGKCGWRLMVVLSTQLESVKVMMPPVTVLPDVGGLTDSSAMRSSNGEGRQVTVADSHIERPISP